MITDNEIKILLRKVKEKIDRYVKYYNKSIEENVFKETGLFDKSGKIVTTSEFKDKFGINLNEGIEMLNDILKPTFFKDLNLLFKEKISEMLNNMGMEEEATEISDMGYREFSKKLRDGVWDNVVEQYKSYKEIEIAEKGSKSEDGSFDTLKKDLSNKILDLLGYES